jgi:hypothetical protein
MSVHKKLMQARIQLQGTKLSKSGKNKFAGYSYFELGDFLPTIQDIFHQIGLCGYISFGKDLATLTITDVDGGGEILITSPMAEANLKGTHPIQNLGAVETYNRRYLVDGGDGDCGARYSGRQQADGRKGYPSHHAQPRR